MSLTKTEMVMNLVYEGACVEFVPEGPSHTRVALPKYVWRDMGSPREITVTVEPGDRLNEESQ